MHAGSPFDLGELSRRIDLEREDQGLTMAALARQVGVAASTIRRFRTADDAEADGVLALIEWLGAPPEDFIENASAPPTTLQRGGTGQIRVDMELVAKATRTRRTSTRTTIQRLTAAALASGQPIAALTRRSQI